MQQTVSDNMIAKEFAGVLDDDVVYLNGASRSPMPRCVHLAGVQALSQKLLPWMQSPSSTASELVRIRFSRLVGFSGSSVAITPSTSFAMSAVANALRDELVSKTVVVLDEQMSSSVLCWQALKNAHLVVVSRPLDGDWTRAVIESIADHKTGAVTVPHCHWADGALLDLTCISKRCCDAGSSLIVDATQSLGVLPVDLDGGLSRLDFLCASTHKWLLGPYGCSPLVVGPERSQQTFRPLVHDEHALVGYTDDGVLPFGPTGYPVAYEPGPSPLNSGGRPNPVILPMVAEGLRFILEDLGGPNAIAEVSQRLATEAKAKVAGIPGVAIKNKRSAPHIVGFRLNDNVSRHVSELWATDCASFLKNHHNVHTTGRLAALRVAFHVYNTSGHIDRFVTALADFQKKRLL